MSERQFFSTYDPADAPQAAKFRGSIPFFIAFILVGLISGSVGPVLPFMSEKLGVPIGDMTYFILFRSFGAMIAGYIFGRLYKNHRSNKILALDLLLMAGMMVLVPLTPSFVFLMVVGFLIGIFHIGIDVGGNSSLIRIHDHASPRYINALHAFFGIGAFFAPLIVTQSILRLGDFSWAFYFFGFLLVINAIIFVFSPSPLVSQEEEERRANSKSADKILLAFVMLMFIFYVGLEIGFTNWIFTYTLETGMGDTAFAGVINSSFWAVFTAGRFLAIPVSKRIKSEWQIVINLSGMILSFIVIMIFPTSRTALVGGIIGAGFFLSSTYPATMGYAQSKMNFTSKEIGLIAILASISAMILPWITGQLFATQGPPWLLYCSLALAGVLSIVFIFMVSYAGKKQRRSEQV